MLMKYVARYFYIFILLGTFLTGLTVAANGTIYNCGKALTALSKYKESTENEEILDNPLKQLAEVLILQSPILLTTHHLRAMDTVLTEHGTHDFALLSYKEKVSFTAEVWEELTKNYKPYAYKNSVKDLSNEERAQITQKALELNLSPAEIISIAQIVKQINESSTLKMETLTLIGNMTTFLTENKGRLSEAETRQKFLRSFFVGGKNKILLSRLEVDKIENGSIFVKRYYDDSSFRIEQTTLADLLTVDQPIINGPVFARSFNLLLEKLGLSASQFKSQFKRYSSEDIGLIAQSFWEILVLQYTAPFASAKSPEWTLWSTEENTRINSFVQQFKLPLDAYIQSALIVKAIDDFPQTRELAVLSLKDILVSINEPKAMQERLDRIEKDSSGFGGTIWAGIKASGKVGLGALGGFASTAALQTAAAHLGFHNPDFLIPTMTTISGVAAGSSVLAFLAAPATGEGVKWHMKKRIRSLKEKYVKKFRKDSKKQVSNVKTADGESE